MSIFINNIETSICCSYQNSTIRGFIYTKNERRFYSDSLQLLLGDQSGTKSYNSALLTKAWGKGHIQLTCVSAATMQYVAKYHVDKITGDQAVDHYSRFIEGLDDPYIVESESSRMSTNPGIGRKWIEKYWTDVYPEGVITLRDGAKVAAPKYYDKWLEQHHPEMYAELKIARESKIDLELTIAKRRDDLDKCRSASLEITKLMRESK